MQHTKIIQKQKYIFKNDKKRTKINHPYYIGQFQPETRKEPTMDWTDQRWQEGTNIIYLHIDYIEEMELFVTCVSKRLANFCITYTR